DQVQNFYPSAMASATTMYHAGLPPQPKWKVKSGKKTDGKTDAGQSRRALKNQADESSGFCCWR
ncbi:DUF3362 domain-containing protein, partial [Bowmanella sp. JS7-9]|uniref:DUF3362 domain-containing protein n=1 Tax=Bowmanella sp. JS7-9 TaxID=1605368 RepID=UPI00103E1D53